MDASLFLMGSVPAWPSLVLSERLVLSILTRSVLNVHHRVEAQPDVLVAASWQ